MSRVTEKVHNDHVVSQTETTYTSNVEGLVQRAPFMNVNLAANDARSRAQAEADRTGLEVGYVVHRCKFGEANVATIKGTAKPAKAPVAESELEPD